MAAGLAAISWTNLVEVEYQVHRRHGAQEEELPGVARMRAVAAHRATLITGAPEIIERADSIPCAVTDARARD
jgi:hypothetical protein